MKKGNCIHAVSPAHSELCKKGVNFRELVGGPNFGWFMRMPCITTDRSKEQVPCKHFSPPTDEQLREWQEKSVEEALLKDCAIGMIKKLDDGLFRGAIKCPKCKESLNYRKSPVNGHIWGLCSTKDCLSWME